MYRAPVVHRLYRVKMAKLVLQLLKMGVDKEEMRCRDVAL
jgi:hypothetical protein